MMWIQQAGRVQSARSMPDMNIYINPYLVVIKQISGCMIRHVIEIWAGRCWYVSDQAGQPIAVFAGQNGHPEAILRG
jgi:hypothetical protein